MGTYHSSANLRPDGAGHSTEGKIRAAHLLVKHKDSRRPSSWREAQITRNQDEAMSIILGHEARIRSGATSLGDLATTESDCSSSRKRGDLYVIISKLRETRKCAHTVAGDFLAEVICRRSLKRPLSHSSPARSAMSSRPLLDCILSKGTQTRPFVLFHVHRSALSTLHKQAHRKSES